MKKMGITFMLLLAMASFTFAQSAATPMADAAMPKADKPTETDMHCSGFITNENISKASYIAAGWDYPNQSVFADRDAVYLHGGSYQVGQKYKIMRETKEVYRYEFYKGQFKDLKAMGHVWEEVGRVRVIDVQKSIGIAVVELGCSAMQAGDIAVPWQEREAPTFKIYPAINRWTPPNGMTTGKILTSNYYDVLIGQKHKVYLNIGANQGVKPGDYFRATRTYTAMMADDNDKLLTKARTQELDIMVQGAPEFPYKKNLAEYPRRTLGEMMVINVTPNSSTAIVTNTIDHIQVGDLVEKMEEPPPPPAPPAVAMNPPTVTCTADAPRISAGESTMIRCTGNSPDNRPLTYMFVADNGTVTPRDNVASLSTGANNAGTITVMTTVQDDRNLSASAVTRVAVAAASAPVQATRVGEFGFKPSSAYVDNRAKAMLDDLALRLNREPGSNAVLVGNVGAREGSRLAMARGTNAKTYLTRTKGIDAARVSVADGGAAGAKADMWFVPAGATAPSITPVQAPSQMTRPKSAPAQRPATKPAATKPATTAKPAATTAKPAATAPATTTTKKK